jgi:hypothetical protein
MDELLLGTIGSAMGGFHTSGFPRCLFARYFVLASAVVEQAGKDMPLLPLKASNYPMTQNGNLFNAI